MSEREYKQSFSDYLFRDVDKSSIGLEVNAPYVVRRVLEFGQFSDWNLLVQRYGIPRIGSIAQNLRTLEPKALSFISAVHPCRKSLSDATLRNNTPRHTGTSEEDSVS